MKAGYYWVRLKKMPNSDWEVGRYENGRLYFIHESIPYPLNVFEIGPEITPPEELRK